MKFLLKIASGIDSFSEKTGTVISWLSLLMVLVTAFNAIARYASKYIGADFSSNAFIELQWYMFSAIFLLGACYTLKHGGHVRVDLVYNHVSARTRCWINLVGTILLLLPFCCLMIWASFPSVRSSWHVWEQSSDPGGLPRYPIKTLVPIAFIFLGAQGLSEMVKNIARLKGFLPLEEQVDADAGEVA